MTTYGLFRTNTMSVKLMTPDLDISEMTDVVTIIAETVISETLLIAGAFCVLTLVIVLRLRSLRIEG